MFGFDFPWWTKPISLFLYFWEYIAAASVGGILVWLLLMFF